MKTFNEFNLSKETKDALAFLDYKHPSDIQELSIPSIQEGNDVFLLANTGSGKTASFAIPIIDEIEWDIFSPQCIVITPTRELAIQVAEEMFLIARFKRLKVETLYGQSSIATQQKALKQRTHIIVATPGRLLDHLEKNSFSLEHVEYVVIDEADEVMDLGFKEQLNSIFSYLPNHRQTIMLSATLNEKVEPLLEKYMQAPKIVKQKKVDLQLNFTYTKVSNDDKLNTLLLYLEKNKVDKALIFCNTKLEVDALYEELRDWNLDVDKLHGDLDQKERLKALDRFKMNRLPFLVATNVAARGIDVSHLDYVIHYDISENIESLTHRSGRTGRMNKEGNVFLIVSDSDEYRFARLQKQAELRFEELHLPWTSQSMDNIEQFFSRKTKLTKVERKGHKFKSEIIKLYIGAGKKDKLRAGDLVGSICSISKVEANDIGVIEILDHFSFVEILNGKGYAVEEALQSTKIKGKIRKVEISG